MKKFNKLIFIFSALLLFSAGSVSADLGISPQDWIEKNGMPGQKIEKTFMLSRSDSLQAIDFTAKISGDLVNWITVENGNNFNVPKGQQQYPVKVILNIPQSAEKKEYKSEIRLRPQPGSSGGQVSVVVEALIRINLTVTDKPFLNYEVQQITIPKQEEGNSLEVILSINNQGNVEAKPTKATVDIFDKFYVEKLGSETFADFSNIKGIQPFSFGNLSFNAPFSLTPEQYWADVTVYQGNEVKKTEHLTFEIVKAGTLKKGNQAVQTLKNNIWLVVVIVLVLLVVALSILLIIRRKKTSAPMAPPPQKF